MIRYDFYFRDFSLSLFMYERPGATGTTGAIHEDNGAILLTLRRDLEKNFIILSVNTLFFIRNEVTPSALKFLKKTLFEPSKFLMGFLNFMGFIFLWVFNGFLSFGGYLIVKSFLGHPYRSPPVSDYGFYNNSKCARNKKTPCILTSILCDVITNFLLVVHL